MNEIRELVLAEAKRGDSASFDVEITKELVAQFVALSGDRNPLHTDEAYAATTSFERTIPHGMIAGCLFSRLVGEYLPGRYAAYLSQSLLFRKPLPWGVVRVSGTIIDVSLATQTIKLSTEVSDDAGVVLVDGEARVRLLR
jgi:acyl dehydratase